MAILSLLTHSWGQDTEECKLSRPGPPATIVTIDEESPNGCIAKNVLISSSEEISWSCSTETMVPSVWTPQ
ncbi:hypothetical protein NQZ68_003016 [Dissostichus eleginoides]|nr:hypothetical protein NQZ68_003016 [Dissostichus eleginoides]